jgi:hypothetical protein
MWWSSEVAGGGVPCGVLGGGVLGGVERLEEVEWWLEPEGNMSSVGRQSHIFRCICRKKGNMTSLRLEIASGKAKWVPGEDDRRAPLRFSFSHEFLGGIKIHHFEK